MPFLVVEVVILVTISDHPHLLDLLPDAGG